jgi:hypothetical protein
MFGSLVLALTCDDVAERKTCRAVPFRYTRNEKRA